MKYIAIGLTVLLVFGCIEVYAEKYTHNYHIKNDITKVNVLFKGKDYIFDNGINIELQEKLTKIMEYYKKEYDFYVRLVVRLKGKKCYQKGKVIFISMEIVKDHAIKMKWKEERLIIFILLHEIKHAIEYTHNRKQIAKDHIESIKNKIPHSKRPHEKRANDFAKKEIDKWI